jgi:hypothetical protein
MNSRYALRRKLPIGMKFIAMRAVATAIVDQIDQTDFLGQAPVIYKQ